MGEYPMREAAIQDSWRRINERKKFRNKVTEVKIPNAGRYSESKIKVNSAITSICGKNGLGKTTLLKLIYKSLSKDELIYLPNSTQDEVSGLEIKLVRDGKKELTIKGDDDKSLPNVDYFDASALLHQILVEIEDSPERNGWMNQAAELDLSPDDLFFIKSVTGKKYQSVKFIEISGIIENTTFPYFEVVTDGIEYTNELMGQGEHKSLLILWKLITAKENSFLLLEEPETYICPYSQKKLIDMVAYYASEKKINVILTTHSEHILEKQTLSSINILRKKAKRKFNIVPAENNTTYLAALGLNSPYSQILFVEDSFAKLFLSRLLKVYDEHLYKTSLIQTLNGESNIQMLTKYYEGASHFQYMAVYDADQRGVNESFKLQIPKAFLPANNNDAPEIEVMNYIEANIGEFAEVIGLSDETVESAIDDLVCDHHDWFRNLAGILEVSEQFLKEKAIDLWCHNNESLCKQFLFEFRYYGKQVDVEGVNRLDKNFGKTSCGLEFPLSFPSSTIANFKEGTKLKGKLKYRGDETVLSVFD